MNAFKGKIDSVLLFASDIHDRKTDSKESMIKYSPEKPIINDQNIDAYELRDKVISKSKCVKKTADTVSFSSNSPTDYYSSPSKSSGVNVNDTDPILPSINVMDELEVTDSLKDEDMESLFQNLQDDLYKYYSENILPSFELFVANSCKKDQTFCMFSNLWKDLEIYVCGYLGIRFNDWEAQLLVMKLMHESVYSSRQSLYKHVLKTTLTDIKQWDPETYQQMIKCPSANVKEGVGVALALDEFHERTYVREFKAEIGHYKDDREADVTCYSAVELNSHRFRNLAEFFHNTEKKQKAKSISSNKLNNDESKIQKLQAKLKVWGAFEFKDERVLKQPETNLMIQPEVAQEFLERRENGRKTCEAIIKQRVLKNKNFDVIALRRKKYRRLPPYMDKKTKRKPNKKKSNNKQMQLLLMQLLKSSESKTANVYSTTGIPLLYFHEEGPPRIKQEKACFATSY